jgi:hypothetical protein
VRVKKPLTDEQHLQFRIEELTLLNIGKLKLMLGLLEDQQEAHPGIYPFDRQRYIRLVDRWDTEVYVSKCKYDMGSVVIMMALLGVCE